MTPTINQTTLVPLKPRDLSELAQVTANPCVSILMRTHRNGRETQQGPIRLKNLLKEANDTLRANGHDDELLEPITSLLNQTEFWQTEFWQHQGEALAIYVTSNDCRLFRLNHRVEEKVSVGESFFVQPLVCEQNAGGQYFVLALSWNEATLSRREGETLTLVETPSLPAKFDELVLPRDPEESLQNTGHRSVGNTAGTSTAIFHGQGEGEDKIEADRDQYLSLVGNEVAAAIYNTGLPLVVIATSEVAGHFEAATKVNVDAKVDGSPSKWSDDEIREHAHMAVRSRIKPDQSLLGERFGIAMAQSQASDDLGTVLKAAEQGKIDLLMVCHNEQHCQQTNRAVIDTLNNGGDVVQCPPESMPSDDAVVAAIFRY